MKREREREKEIRFTNIYIYVYTFISIFYVKSFKENGLDGMMMPSVCEHIGQTLP